MRLAARLITTMAVCLVMIPALQAQTPPPKVEWFLGYSFWRALPTSPSNRIGYLHGGTTSVAYNFNSYFGLVADFAGFDNSKVTLLSPTTSPTVASGGKAFTYLFGPRFSYRHRGFTPYVQALFGAAHAGSVTIDGCTLAVGCTPLGSDTAFTTMAGVGFDINLSQHVALRPFEGDLLYTRFRDSFSATGERGWQKNVRLSTGIVFRFGSMDSPVASAAAACSAEPAEVFPGEPVTGTATGSNFNPKRTTKYSWSGTGVKGGGNSSTQIDTAGLQPGSYQVNANLSDGSKRGVASCLASFRVKQPRAPEVACSSDPGTVRTGGTATIRANASSPDNRRLTYSYSTSAGNISGTAANATLNTAGASPGSIRVTCAVSDDRDPALTASAVTTINVAAPPPPPPPAPAPPVQPTVLETRLALHSIYFQTARPTASDPTRGVLDSQQKILTSLASDFKEYLRTKPQAHLTLEGHADPRGSDQANQILAQRRVDRTKMFLIGKGVPSANIEVKAFGDQQNLSDDEVKAAVQQNPELSEADRQRILNNMSAIILASNRRVDVVLSTTGQQSIRQYPFNAKDYLPLIRTQGEGTKKTLAQK